jgi:hypothetical protein
MEAWYGCGLHCCCGVRTMLLICINHDGKQSGIHKTSFSSKTPSRSGSVCQLPTADRRAAPRRAVLPPSLVVLCRDERHRLNHGFAQLPAHFHLDFCPLFVLPVEDVSHGDVRAERRRGDSGCDHAWVDELGDTQYRGSHRGVKRAEGVKRTAGTKSTEWM